MQERPINLPFESDGEMLQSHLRLVSTQTATVMADKTIDTASSDSIV